MKKILFSLVAGLIATVSSAQLQSGSVCPDFTGTDLDGNTWNLYDLLDEGYSVVIDVSATWCGPCWGYHNTEALENLYTLYGPEGTNEVRVFFIEGDGSTNLEDLNGNTGDSQGDWVTGTSYPIIDDASIANDILDITYFPTIYTVCPSRIITETSQISTAQHYAFVQQNACGLATFETDPAFNAISASDLACNGDVDLKLSLLNLGTTPLTAATIVVTGGVTDVTYDWTGDLDTYEIEEIEIASIATSGNATLTATISSPDGDIPNNIAAVQLAIQASTTHIKVDWLFDEYPQEVSWKITNEGGTIMASAAVGSYPQITYSGSPLLIDVYLPTTGCYKFTYTDDYGDGLYTSTFEDIPRHCYVYGVAADGTSMDYIYNYDGSYGFGPAQIAASESKLANVNEEVTSLKENAFESQFSISPNPTFDQVNVKFSLENSATTNISVTNILGQVVSNMTLGKLAAGVQNQVIDLSNLEAGIYQITINAGSSIGTKKVTLVK